jgi:tetratricopeptide (TPR) repeat protein
LRERFLLLVCCCLACCGTGEGSSALLRSPAANTPPTSSRRPANVTTWSGTFPVVTTDVHPSPAVTFVLLMDTISSQQIPIIKQDLLSAYTVARGARTRLAMLQGGHILVAGPFPTRVRFKAALDEIRLPAAPETPITGESIAEALFDNVGQLGSDWSTAVLTGNLPALDPLTTDYASALLAREFASQHVRVSCLTAAPLSAPWTALLQATSGDLLSLGSKGLTPVFDISNSYVQADWTVQPPASGFVRSSTIIKDQSGAPLLEIPELSSGSQAMTPSLALYRQMRTNVAQAAALMQSPTLSPDEVKQVQENLRIALGINSRDADALSVAAALFEKTGDHSEAAKYHGYLLEVKPLDGAAQATAGHAYLLAADLDRAEAALDRALETGTRTPQIIEDLGRLRVARKDDGGALPFFDELLTGAPGRQDIWFLKAQAEERLSKNEAAIASYERGLTMGGMPLDVIRSLLNLYIKTKQPERSRQLAASTIAQLPNDAAVRTDFASTLEQLALNAEALQVWRSVVELTPNSQRAYERITRLLLESNQFAAAEKAADKGLAVLPTAAELYLSKSEALQKQGHLFAARRVLEQGVEATPDLTLLQKLANVSETFVGSAAPIYRKLAEAETSPEKRVAELELGLKTAIRDADFKNADALAAMLESAGHPDARSLLGRHNSAGDSTSIPGGLAALGFAAHSNERASPEKFFVEFSRALIDHSGTSTDAKAGKEYLEGISQYLERVSSLEQLGTRAASGIHVTLSLNDKDARKRTEAVLALLGSKIRYDKKSVELNFGEGKSQARKQETLAALAIDQVGIQEALQAGKSYDLEIPYEQAVIYPNERMWRDAFYAHENQNSGFITALIRSPKLARLYLGMSYLDRETIAQLLGAVDLKTLADQYAELFYVFAPAFAIHQGTAVCPGGVNGLVIWERIVGVSPRQPGRFFRALLDRDDGKLLAFFYAVSHLDRAHQIFFTATPSRTEQFYRLFVAFKDRQPGSITLMRDSSFQDFLRAVPLTAEGHVRFPGSPAVWMVAKGSTPAETKMDKLAKASSRWVGTDVEDAILLRLAQARYKESGNRHNELDNFLAVARIDAHRSGPMDEESALLLAQHFSDESPAYPYFTDLTAVTAADLRQFFSVLEQFRSQALLDANLRLGQLHAVIELLCLLEQRQKISPEDAATLFRATLQRFAAAGPGGYAFASLDAVQRMLAFCHGSNGNETSDEQINACLGGSAPGRQQEFQRVLEAQKVPLLNSLLTISGAAQASDGINGAALLKAASSLPSVEIPAKTRIGGKEKEAIQRYSPAGLVRLCTQLSNEASASSKKKSSEVAHLRNEVAHELEPQVVLALAGIIYAYFMRSSDLLISEDPLLLRKHHFSQYGMEEHSAANLNSEFHVTSEGAGSYFSGGFGEFALAAGIAAGSSWKAGGESGRMAIAAQIAAIRATPWELITEADFRMLGLRVAIGREWIVQAALKPDVLDKLRDSTAGLLSLSRRADLVIAISTRDWKKAWEAVTVSDLLALGTLYDQAFPTSEWDSPTVRMLQSMNAAKIPSHLQVLGALAYRSLGCTHPHWAPMAPYEEFEHRFFPVESAERWAEFKIFLAFQADLAGDDALEISRVAEPLAAKAFRSAQSTDFRDWRAFVAAYATVSTIDIRKALQQ